MCIAILRPGNKDIPIENLRESWLHNNDGAGYAFVKDGKVVIRKGFMKLINFLENYNTDVKDNTDSPFLVHFRIRTHGEKDEANTHPFEIPGGALIHNGCLTGTYAKYGIGDSDTKKFVSKFGEHLNYNFVLANKMAFNDAVYGSKLAMLYDDSSYLIINEKDGVWDNGVWYSNTSYKSYRNPTAHGWDDFLE